MDAAALRTTMKLRAAAAMSAYTRADAHSTVAMISLTAPAALDAHRAPLDILCVIDRSGSMSGEKMALMRQTLGLLVSRAGLSSADKVGIVSFSTEATTELPLTRMDGAGLSRAKKVVEGLRAGGGTNLSGGLLQGLQMLVDSAGGGEECATATRCVLLFTDGQANGGIMNPADIVLAAQGALAGSPTQIFSFGFGASHNEDLLLSLSRATLGQYYFLKEAEAIPAAFADCLGGLVSVVAQNATLSLRPTGGRHACAALGQLLGDAYASTTAEDGSIAVRLGDLFSEDEKDVLLELKLPPMPAGGAAGQQDQATAAETAAEGVEGWTLVDGAEAADDGDAGGVEGTPAASGAEGKCATDAVVALTATLRFFSVLSKRFEEVHTQLWISRPEDARAATVNHKVDEQANRTAVAAAIKQATRVADRGDVGQGRALLQAALGALARSPSAASSVSQALSADVQRLAVDYEHLGSYRSVGSKRSKMSAMSHSYQRSTHDEEMPSHYAAGSESKGSMKRGWSHP